MSRGWKYVRPHLCYNPQYSLTNYFQEDDSAEEATERKKDRLPYDFVKSGRRNNTNKVSLSSEITQTHPKITSRSLTTLTEFQFNFKSWITAILTDNWKLEKLFLLFQNRQTNCPSYIISVLPLNPMSYKHVGGLYSAGGVHGLRRSIARIAPAPHLPLLSLQYTQYYIQDGIIGKTPSIDFWTETRQPINLSPIFARHWHHISICFKPFHVNQQARCLEFFKSSSPMILCSSFDGPMVCRWTVRHSTVCPRPLLAKSLSSLLPVPSYWISWLRFHNICPAWDGVCGRRSTFSTKDQHFHFPGFLTIKLN